jgi:hypothetical protein
MAQPEDLPTLVAMLSNQDNAIKKNGISKIEGLITTTQDKLIAQDAFIALIPVLLEKDPALKLSAARAISHTVLVSKEPIIAKETFFALALLLEDSDKEVKREAIKMLTEIVKVGSSNMVVKEALLAFNSLLRDDSQEVRDAAIHARGRLIKNISSSRFISYLEDDNPQIRQLAIETLAIRLTNWYPKKDFELTETILYNIIAHEREDGERKELIKAAKRVLLQQQEYIDDEVIVWANEKFEELFDASPATKDFFKAIYHKALSDGQISENDSKFILSCIKHGFTTSIAQDRVTKNYRLIFEGRVYELNGIENAKYLEQISEEVTRQADELDSYQRYNRLFANSGIGLRIAALDIERVPGLTGSDLTHDEWQVSLVEELDGLGQETNNQFILAEKRDVFGNHVIHKIKSDLTTEHYLMHPDDVTTDFCKRIFGEMRYGDNYPLYYSTSISLSNSEKEGLLGNFTAESFQSMFAEKRNIEPRSLYKEDVLKISGEERDQLINMRQTIDNTQRISHIEDMMQRNIGILSKVIAREEVAKVEDGQLSEIYQDAYSRSLYENLRMQLNAMYLAATTISTGMVQNQKRGVIGNVGTLLQSVSAHIPIIGAGVNFFASILSAYDNQRQADKVKAYTNLVLDSNEMAKLSSKISLQIVAGFQLKGHLQDQMIRNIVGTLKQVQTAATKVTHLSANLPEFIVKGYQQFSQDVNNALKGTQPTPEEKAKAHDWKEGEHDAGIVLKAILESIYDEKEGLLGELNRKKAIHDEDQRVAGKAELIVSFIVDRYKIPKNGAIVEVEEVERKEAEPTTVIAAASSSRVSSNTTAPLPPSGSKAEKVQPKGCCVLL